MSNNKRYEIIKDHAYYYVNEHYKAKRWWFFGEEVWKVRERISMYNPDRNNYYYRFISAEAAESHLNLHINLTEVKVIKVIEVG